MKLEEFLLTSTCNLRLDISELKYLQTEDAKERLHIQYFLNTGELDASGQKMEREVGRLFCMLSYEAFSRDPVLREKLPICYAAMLVYSHQLL